LGGEFMAVSKPASKKLWSLSGNKCAICKTYLINEDRKVIGEECHIVGREPGSERHDPSKNYEELDSYENLILLCPNHHTLIDKKGNGEVYTVEYLIDLKMKHENEQFRNISIVLNEQELSEEHLEEVYKKLEIDINYDLFKETFQEFFDLTDSEQQMIFYFVKKYHKGKFNVPKVAKKVENNIWVIDSLLQSDFLSFMEEISLLIDTGFGIEDLNSNIFQIVKPEYADNWDLGKHGRILHECYVCLECPKELDEFKLNFKLE
jgi:hypothetical protein